ncbi:MAG: ABC transporter permease [Christensenellales bacterium]
MSVFKLYFKVIRKALPSILIYLCVFLALSVMFSFTSPTQQSGGYEQTRLPVVLINRDDDTPLTQGLRDFLAGEQELRTDLPDEPEALQDALFMRQVAYVAIIPEGFTAAFQTDSPLSIQQITVPDSTYATYIGTQIDQYISTVAAYHRALPALSLEAVVQKAGHTLDQQATVSLAQSQVAADSSKNFIAYYCYLAYVLLAFLILGITTIMLVFHQQDLRRRLLSSPLSLSSINFQLALGNTLFALVCWGIMSGVSLLLYRGAVQNPVLLLLCMANALVFTVVGTALAFLLGNFIKSYSVQGAVANVLSLGMGFIGGVFVPQAMMSEGVLSFARILPTYWYVHAVNAISELKAFTASQLAPIYTDMAIQLGFAAAIFAVALFVSKQRQTQKS